VSDDVTNLDSLGRKQSAEVQKHAAIAEARNDSTIQSARADMAGGDRRETKAVAMVAEPRAAAWATMPARCFLMQKWTPDAHRDEQRRRSEGGSS